MRHLGGPAGRLAGTSKSRGATRSGRSQAARVASRLRRHCRTLAQASHLSPARVALLWRGAKAARVASPTPVTCANRMRAAGITALGEPVEMFEVDELPTPGAGEVLIDVVAAGIGNRDELVRIGSWRIGGPAPMALGTEAAGTVAAAGSGVAELREGDEVMTHPLPLRRHGTWAG